MNYQRAFAASDLSAVRDMVSPKMLAKIKVRGAHAHIRTPTYTYTHACALLPTYVVRTDGACMGLYQGALPEVRKDARFQWNGNCSAKVMTIRFIPVDELALNFAQICARIRAKQSLKLLDAKVRE